MTSFLYDQDGTRVKSVLGGVTTKTPTAWYNVSGTTPTKHILTPDGEMLATVERGMGSGLYILLYKGDRGQVLRFAFS